MGITNRVCSHCGSKAATVRWNIPAQTYLCSRCIRQQEVKA